MKFLAVAILFAFTDAIVIGKESDCVIIRNVNYEKQVILKNLQSPYQLAIDHDTNTLFFSYTARTDEMFKSAYLSLKTNEHRIISGIRGGFANAVNSKSHTVYLGGDDGLYEYDYETKTAIKIDLKKNFNIWQLFYKNELYFTTYPEEKAYLYKNEEVIEVPEFQNLKIMLLAVNNDNNFVYTNSSGIFMHNKAKKDSIHLSNLIANGITSDIEGNLYISTPNGIYAVNDKTKTLDNLVNIDNIYGVAVESNGNLIYAAEESLIRLKVSKKVCIDDKIFIKSGTH